MTRPALAAALMLFFSPGAAAAEVVLLRNGSVLEGRIEQRTGEVVVYQAGGAILLRASEVAHQASDRVGIYEWMRQKTAGADNLDQHLARADWAIENSLWPQAARELLEARQIAPSDRRLELLERRFDELTRPRAEIVHRSATTAKPTKAAKVEVVPELPAGELVFFTRRIQPLLKNGCALAGCHRGQPGDAFALDPLWVRGHATAGTTARNLQTTLDAMDFNLPAESPLLAAARGPHHGVTPFVGPRRAEILARIEGWIARVAAKQADQVDPPLAEAAVEQSPVVDPEVTPATFHADPPKIIRGARLRRAEPRDEFDPAIFNKRFRRPQDDEPLSSTPAPSLR